MPRGALSWALLMASRRTVIWGGGINTRVQVVGGHSWMYKHTLAIYMHIRHIHAYTYIDLGRVCIYTYTCIYVHILCHRQIVPPGGASYMCKCMHIIHIHAYTVYVHICSYMLIMLKYSYIYLHVHAYAISRNWTDP
jgi:hypothetical protein